MENKLTTTTSTATGLTTLGVIEYRMDRALQDLRTGYLELGRCLIEAKEAQLVPHGQWESWVREHACMSERQAQKLMQIARTVESGSALARLDISKIQTLLALPEGQREELAEKAEREDLSLRQLQDEVRQLKEEKLRANQRADERVTNSYRMGFDAGKAAGEKAGRKEGYASRDEALNSLGQAQRQLEQHKKNTRQLREYYDQLIEEYRRKLAEASEQAAPNEDQAREIEKLQADLTRATEYAKHQAELRKEAQEKLLAMQESQSRGDTGSRELDVGASVRRFIGELGIVQHMGDEISTWPKAKRNELKMYLDTIETWLHNTRKALSVVAVGGDGHE